MCSHVGCRRAALKCSEHCCGGCGPKLYTVKKAAKFLDCCDRQLRQEITELKITHRRGPGGIRFTKEDLLERLRPIGGPSATSRSSKKARKLSVSETGLQAKLTAQLGVELNVALQVLEDTLRDQSPLSTKVATLLESCRNGELWANLDASVAMAIIAVIAARALGGDDAEPLLRTFFARTEGLP